MPRQRLKPLGHLEWKPEPDALYIRVKIEQRPNEAGKSDEWIVAQIVVNSQVAGEGECKNTGLYKAESIAEKTAITQAKFDFDRRYIASCPVVTISSTPSSPSDTPSRSSKNSSDGSKITTS